MTGRYFSLYQVFVTNGNLFIIDRINFFFFSQMINSLLLRSMMKINIPASSLIFLSISYYFSGFQIFLSQSSSIIISNYLFSTGFFFKVMKSQQMIEMLLIRYTSPTQTSSYFLLLGVRWRLLSPLHSDPIIVVYYTEISLALNYIPEQGNQVLR